MAAHVQSTGVQSSGPVTSQGKAFTSNTTTGNLIVVLVALYRNVAGSPPGVSTITDGGNTYVQFPGSYRQSTADARACVEIWYAKNITGGTTPTVTVTPESSSYTSFSITEVSGLDTSSPEDTQNDSEGNSSSPSTGAFSTTTSGFSVGVVTHTSTTTTITEDSGGGWAVTFEAENATNQPIGGEYKVTSAASQNPSWTFGASKPWIATGAGFKDAAGGGGSAIAHITTTAGMAF